LRNGRSNLKIATTCLPDVNSGKTVSMRHMSSN